MTDQNTDHALGEVNDILYDFMEGDITADAALTRIRQAVLTPAQVGTALGHAEARFNPVFEAGRGRFREGMSIAQSIYRKAILDELVEAPK